MLAMGTTALRFTREVVLRVDLVVRPPMGRVKACLRLLVVVCLRTPMIRAIVQLFPIFTCRMSNFVSCVVQALYDYERAQCEGGPWASVPPKRGYDVYLVDRVVEARVRVSRVARRDASAVTLFIRVTCVGLLAQDGW